MHIGRKTKRPPNGGRVAATVMLVATDVLPSSQADGEKEDIPLSSPAADRPKVRMTRPFGMLRSR